MAELRTMESTIQHVRGVLSGCFYVFSMAHPAMKHQKQPLWQLEHKVTRKERSGVWLGKVTGLPASGVQPRCVFEARILQLTMAPDAPGVWTPLQALHLFVFGAELVLALAVPRWTMLGALRDDELVYQQTVPLRRVSVGLFSVVGGGFCIVLLMFVFVFVAHGGPDRRSDAAVCAGGASG
jgi:hypothetical protein